MPKEDQELREKATPARQAAFAALKRVAEEEAFASNLIASSAVDSLYSEDRRLAQELVLGVLRWQGQLDYFISRYSNRAVSKLDLPVLLALRLGLYQIRFLSRIPQSAAVNESVKLVKAAGKPGAAGFVNAVLRAACRNLNDAPGAELKDKIARLSVETAHPQWLLERWIARFGFEQARRLALANNEIPPPSFRVNTLKISRTDVRRLLQEKAAAIIDSPFVPGAFTVEDKSAAPLLPLVEDGLIYIQSEASQLIPFLLGLRPGMKVLDLCAAPGGKTTHAAALMNNQGLIVAGDIHLHRLNLVKQACRRAGATIARLIVLDATQELPFAENEILFDRVLVDAPCSGTGTLRHNPEIKWRLGEDKLRELSLLQQTILSQAAKWVAPGGRLVYSTCSLEPEEGEDVVEQFLLQGTFRLLEPEAAQELRTERKFIRTFPHSHNLDGFFAAVMERARD